MTGRSGIRARTLTAALFALAAVGHAAVLPDDRADFLWHDWQGGGVTVDGPSILVRKSVNDSLSFAANYYVDMISSASVDVLSTASPYKETRRQGSISADYLHGNTTYSLGFIQSHEPDYKANTGFFSISQSMFGDLTTISFGYTRGWDKVGEDSYLNGRYADGGRMTTWVGDADHRNWQASISQILTRNLLMSLNVETDESDGYLQSPYRTARYISPEGLVQQEAQVTPNTRTGNAGSLQLKYYLPWHAALDANYRIYHDTWGILAHTIGAGYTQPIFSSWTLNGTARYYRQGAANFYGDLFPFEDSQNFMSRDRELAKYHDLTLGLGASWQFRPSWPHWIEKGTLNLSYDRMHIAYDDFHNYTVGGGTQGVPLYSYDANVTQFFISLWY
jgi:Protein of unknown function (DUF3570)